MNRGLTGLKENSTYQSGQNPNSLNADIVVNVIYTDLPGTLAALQSAEALAQRLQARITLLAAHSVPYDLPITHPPVSLEFVRRRLVELAQQAKLRTSVEIYICRDRTLCIQQVLSSKSLVVLGVKRRWWPTMESKLAKRLESAGHQIIFVEPVQLAA